MNTMTVSCRSTEQFLMILSASKQYMDIGPDVIFLVTITSGLLCVRMHQFLSASLHFSKEALIEIGCVVTSLVGCHARALWPNGAS